jgi:copper resistance protein C
MIPAKIRLSFRRAVAPFLRIRQIRQLTGVLMSRLIRIFAVATVLNAGLLGQVLAHAHLESAVPAENAIVKVSPVEIDLTFSEGLNLKFSGATITGPGKATISTGQAKLSINDHKTLVIPLSAPLASGEYTVNWTALSTDGHKTKGSYTFTVKP